MLNLKYLDHSNNRVSFKGLISYKDVYTYFFFFFNEPRLFIKITFESLALCYHYRLTYLYSDFSVAKNIYEAIQYNILNLNKYARIFILAKLLIYVMISRLNTGFFMSETRQKFQSLFCNKPGMMFKQKNQISPQ
jgi:hypothetical protein